MSTASLRSSNPFTGEGIGGSHFSWSAALMMDLIRRPVE